MKLVIFYSIITFSYTKYFVHSYIVDVVFTLSYNEMKQNKLNQHGALFCLSPECSSKNLFLPYLYMYSYDFQLFQVSIYSTAAIFREYING